MGWAGKHLPESDRVRIARGLFEVDDSISTEEWLNGGPYPLASQARRAPR